MFEGPSITEHAMDIVEDADQQAICTDQQSIYSIREAMDTNDDIFDTIKNPQSTTEASLDILPTSSVLPTWDTILAGDTLVTIEGRQGDRKMTFARPPSKSGEPKHEWTVKLPFHGWSMAIHPPTNVVAVSENTGSVSYVTSKSVRFRARLTNFKLTQGRPDSYSDNGHRRTSPLR